MAQRELAWQSKMVTAIKAYGGYAQKTAHRTKVGVPDLLVKLPDRAAALIEVKHVVLTSDQKIVNIELTKPQALHLKSFTRAGGCGLWVAVCTFTYRHGVVHMLASSDLENLKWDIKDVMSGGTTFPPGAFIKSFPTWLRSITR